MYSSSIKESFGPMKMEPLAIVGILIGSMCGFFLILYLIVFYLPIKK
jgi:hypothetical protein